MIAFDPELAARMKMPKELLDRAPELHLALHIGEHHVHAALYDFAASTCFWNVQSEVPEHLSVYTFIYQRNWIEGVFRRCTVTFDSDAYALVPLSLFDAESNADYLQMQHGLSGMPSAFFELPEAEAVVVYEIPEWQQDLMRSFPNARVLPLSALLTKLAVAKVQQSGEEFLLAYSSGTVTIAAVKGKNLLLLATHEARTPEDVLYHLSNAAMRLQIDLENCSLELLEITAGNELAELLARYVHEVKLLTANSSMEGPAITQIHYLCA